jgi:drug/metabolite transporter (DMT)-like permease
VPAVSPMPSLPVFFKRTGFLAMLACLLWSSAFPCIKIGLHYTTPLQFAGMRFMLSGLMLLPFCGGLAVYLKTVAEHRRTVLLVAFFQTAFTSSMLYIGLGILPSAIGAIITGSQPLMIAVMAHFVVGSEKMTRRRLISIFLGLIGISIIGLKGGDIAAARSSELPGLLMLLLSNISSGIGNILVAKTRSPIPPLILNSSQLFLGGLITFLVSMPVEGLHLGSSSAAYILALLWLSSLSAIAFSIWFILLRRKGVAVADLNLWLLLIPVSGACLSWIFLAGESPTPHTVFGMLCIAMALLILNFRAGRPLTLSARR